MLSDAHLKPAPFEKIVVWKGSRIARNVEDRLACESLLARKGIEIISVTEPSFEGATKVLMLPVMAAVDAYQSALIAEDTLRSMKMNPWDGDKTKTERDFIGQCSRC